MKHALLLVLILLTGCTTKPIDKAEETVTKFMNESLNDKKSYESVKWSTLDSSFSQYFQQDTYKELMDKIDKYLKDATEAQTNADIYSLYLSPELHNKYVKEQGEYADSGLLCLDKRKQFEGSFKSKFTGFAIIHTYRAKNLLGNLGIHQTEFFLNPTLDTVINSEELNQTK